AEPRARRGIAEARGETTRRAARPRRQHVRGRIDPPDDAWERRDTEEVVGDLTDEEGSVGEAERRRDAVDRCARGPAAVAGEREGARPLQIVAEHDVPVAGDGRPPIARVETLHTGEGCRQQTTGCAVDPEALPAREPAGNARDVPARDAPYGSGVDDV